MYITGMAYPSKIVVWEFEKNNPSFVPNVIYTKEMEISPAYISKYSSICK